VTQDEPIELPSERLLDALEVAVVVFDRDGHILTANRRARADLAVLGDIWDQSLFRSDVELIDEHGVVLPVERVPPVHTLRTGESLTDVVVGARTRMHPHIVWITIATQPLRDDRGVVTGVITSFYDITEQRNAQAALRISEERFRLIAENAADVVYRFQVGAEPSFDYVNPAVEAVLGYQPQEFYDDPGLIVRVTHEDDVEIVRDLGVHGVEDVRSVQLRMIRRDGTMIWTEHRVVPLRDADGSVGQVAGIARDVTALKIREAYLSHRALHDPLTGLPNRVLLLDRLEAALARIRRHKSYLAVLYLDLDRFKTVNDNLGHDTGDRLLHVVARRLQDTLRPSDSVARLGGDEFAAILPDLNDPREATVVAERLLAAVAEPADLVPGGLVTTVSIGIASAGDGETSAGELLRRADFAMYTAKDRGRARVESYDDLGPSERPRSAGGDPADR
jgi:diguanylate cyclase (GGDEF)-like protein/PAS domain S-box-containing protein